MIHNLKSNVGKNVMSNIFRYLPYEARFVTTSTGSVTIDMKGISGRKLVIEPGDGSALERITYLGTGTNVPWTHDYSGPAGTKTVTFRGVENITSIDTKNNNTLAIDIDQFLGFRNCNVINTGYATLTGNAANLNAANFPSLTALIIRYCSLSFTPSDLQTLTNLYSLYAYNNNGTGDLGGFATLSNLDYFRVNDNAFTYLQTTSWHAYNGVTIQLQSTLSTAAEVDRFIIDSAASSWTSNTINFAGTNPARTSASDADLVASILAGNIWTLN
jgi:hypothetical protein